jgi:hypothetical protein
MQARVLSSFSLCLLLCSAIPLQDLNRGTRAELAVQSPQPREQLQTGTEHQVQTGTEHQVQTGTEQVRTVQTEVEHDVQPRAEVDVQTTTAHETNATRATVCETWCAYNHLGERHVTANANACKALCSSSSSCAFFSWWSDGGCHFSPSGATKSAAGGGQKCGPKSCVFTDCGGSASVNCKYTPFDIDGGGSTYSAKECAKWCHDDGNCKYWTFQPNGECSFARSGATKKTDSGSESCGTSSCSYSTPCNAPNCEYTGFSPPRSASSAANCQQLCKQTSRCEYYSFRSGSCSLAYDADEGEIFHRDGSVCGTRDCTFYNW